MLDLRHRRMRRAVEAYIDGERLAEVEPARVRDHLERCPDCRHDAARLRDLKGALRRIGRRRPIDITVARLRRWARDLSG